MIVDTSFVLDIIDGIEQAVEKERGVEAAGVPLVIPAMTLLELYIGVGKVANSTQERQQVEAILDTYPLVEMTSSISRRAGRLLGEQMNAGDGDGPGIGKVDAAIAATALERGGPILTADSHFETIDGIEVETYR